MQKNKNIYIDFLNGYTDHIHCLISLNADYSIGKIVQLIKGESSRWINQNKLTGNKFEWQDEYFAIGVGNDKIDVLRKYIANQPEHHKKITFQKEYEKFIKHYGINIINHD